MQLVVLTPPDNVVHEHQVIRELFAYGLKTLHIRKPQLSKDLLRRYIDHIPAKYHSSLMLHAHHQLSLDYNIKGIHYTEATRPKQILRPQTNHYISTSFHSLAQLRKDCNYGDLDYAFLSPIYDSISKPNYKRSQFDTEELKKTLNQVSFNVLGLGGIRQEKIKELHTLGFGGIALLGAIWNSKDPVNEFRSILTECAKY